MICTYCRLEFKLLVNHQAYCKKNPNKSVHYNGKIGKPGSNQFLKAKKLGLNKPHISDETRLKLANGGKAVIWTNERRQQHSISMKQAVATHPESYTSANRGRVKQFIVDGIKFQGRWELAFYEYCLLKNIAIKRVNVSFPYEWHGTRSGIASILATSKVEAFIMADDSTADHTAADHRYFPQLASLTCGTPTAATGFTIYARSIHKLTGQWSIRWVWAD